MRSYSLSACTRLLAVSLLAWLALLAPTPAAAQGDAAKARDELRPWAARIDTAVARLNAGDLAAAETEFEAYYKAWFDIEDDIRPVSRPHYREIERAMADGRVAFASRPVDPAAVGTALKRLQALNASFLAGTPVPEAEAASGAAAEPEPPAIDNPTPTTLVELLNATLAALDRNDVAGAKTQLRQFQSVWLDVEGLVKARSASVYTDTENRTAEAAALLNQNPPDVARAREAIVAMRTDLQPIADAGSHYTYWDAAIILLREGFEALLIIAALVAFLQRSGNADKRRWIWVGGAVGILASLVVAAIAAQVLSRAAAGSSRELIEGLTGLVAAAMLLYVGWWLHSNSSLQGWQSYIQNQTTRALSQGSLLGLAFIAFLAVFREGAETVLFYVGIASSISFGDLLLGLGIGFGGLAILTVLMLVAGSRIPIRPFFLVATVLIYYLCIKFVGMGIHALQVSGYLPATPGRYLPSIDWLGVFPTWETTIAQLAVLALILVTTFGVRRLPQRRTQPA